MLGCINFFIFFYFQIFSKSKEAFDERTTRQVFRTNFYGTVELTEALLPSIKDFGKIVIVGSTMGKYKLALKSEDLKK